MAQATKRRRSPKGLSGFAYWLGSFIRTQPDLYEKLVTEAHDAIAKRRKDASIRGSGAVLTYSKPHKSGTSGALTGSKRKPGA